MAVTEKLSNYTMIAGAALSQFRGVVYNASAQVVAPSLGGRIDGVTLMASTAAGQPITVARDGKVTMVASASIAAGANVAVTATGLAITGVTGNVIIGTALEAAVVNQVFQVQLRPDGTLVP